MLKQISFLIVKENFHIINFQLVQSHRNSNPDKAKEKLTMKINNNFNYLKQEIENLAIKQLIIISVPISYKKRQVIPKVPNF